MIISPNAAISAAIASRRTDRPAARITSSSLLAASAPSPCSVPISTAMDSISYARLGSEASTNVIA